MRVLSEDYIQKSLKSLGPIAIQDFQDALFSSLLEYKEDKSIVPERIVTKRGDVTHLFMASVGSNVGMKALTGSSHGFNGASLIIDRSTGEAKGMLNAKTLTAFRTALCSTIPLTTVFPTDNGATLKDTNLVTFGVGLQAYWHIRLTLVLYPHQFSKVFICNRTLEKAINLCEELSSEFHDTTFLPLQFGESEKISSACHDASIIYGCTPSTSPLVMKSYLDNNPNDRVFISVIGSYKPHMVEVEGQLVKCILANNGKIVVDSAEHVSHEAGEIIQNEVPTDSLVEICDFVHDQKTVKSKLILVKIVGLSLMDISVGSKILQRAEANNEGSFIDF